MSKFRLPKWIKRASTAGGVHRVVVQLVAAVKDGRITRDEGRAILATVVGEAFDALTPAPAAPAPVDPPAGDDDDGG